MKYVVIVAVVCLALFARAGDVYKPENTASCTICGQLFLVGSYRVEYLTKKGPTHVHARHMFEEYEKYQSEQRKAIQALYNRSKK